MNETYAQNAAGAPAGAAGQLVHELGARAASMQRLTAREREVAALVAVGCVNKQVADRLGMAQRTVEAHLRSIFAKLGVDRRAAVAFLYARTLPEPAPREAESVGRPAEQIGRVA